MKSFDVRIRKAVSTLRQTDFPTQVILELASGCNLACRACPSRLLERPKGRIPFDLATRIIDEIADENPGTELYPAFMGEALLHPRWFDIIAHARARGLQRIYLNTNAMLMDADVAGRVLDSGVHRVIVSIDGFSAETYEARRVKGVYECVVANTLGLLSQARARDSAPEIWVQMIIDDGNAHEEEAFKAFWLGQGAVVKLRPQLTWGGRVGRNSLADLEVERVVCPWLARQIIVTWEGRVGMCDADHEAALDLGDLNHCSLRDAWNGKLKELRARHLRGDFSHRLCQECDDWKVGASEVFRPDGEGGA